MNTKLVPAGDYIQGKILWEMLMVRFLEKYCGIARPQARLMVDTLEPQDKLRIACEMYMHPECLDLLTRSIRRTEKITAKDKAMLEGWKNGAVVCLKAAGWCEEGVVLEDPEGILFVVRVPESNYAQYVLEMPGYFWYNMLPYSGYITFHVNWGHANPGKFQPLEIPEEAYDLSSARQAGLVIETPDQLKKYAASHRQDFEKTMASDTDPMLFDMKQTTKIFPDLQGGIKDSKTTSVKPAADSQTAGSVLPYEIGVRASNLWKQVNCQFMDTFCRAKYKNILRNYDRLGPFNKTLTALTLYEYPQLYSALINNLLDRKRITNEDAQMIRSWKDGMVLKLRFLGKDQNGIIGQDEDGIFYQFKVLAKNIADMLEERLPCYLMVCLIPAGDEVVFVCCAGFEDKAQGRNVNVKALLEQFKKAKARGEVIETPEQLSLRADQKRPEFISRLNKDLAEDLLNLNHNASYQPNPEIIKRILEEQTRPSDSLKA